MALLVTIAKALSLYFQVLSFIKIPPKLGHHIKKVTFIIANINCPLPKTQQNRAKAKGHRFISSVHIKIVSPSLVPENNANTGMQETQSHPRTRGQGKPNQPALTYAFSFLFFSFGCFQHGCLQ